MRLLRGFGIEPEPLVIQHRGDENGIGWEQVEGGFDPILLWRRPLLDVDPWAVRRRARAEEQQKTKSF
jgi:hypothetical protein